MKQILAEIKDGTFAREWVAEATPAARTSPRCGTSRRPPDRAGRTRTCAR
jgi:ketol-acid reductoisomerase